MVLTWLFKLARAPMDAFAASILALSAATELDVAK
jgi:hypothetical protein